MKRSALLCLLISPMVSADSITLKNGFTLEGLIDLKDRQITVRTQAKTYYVSSGLLADAIPSTGGEPPETFSLKQPTSRQGRKIESLTHIERSDPFDTFGRRTIYVRDKDGREVAIHQAITEIYPDHVTIDGINFSWRTFLSLREIPRSELMSILEKVAEDGAPPDQLKLAHFLLQAGLFDECRRRLALIREKHPDLASRATELGEKLSQAISDHGMAVVHRSLDIGDLSTATVILDEFKRVGAPAEHQAKWSELAGRHDAIVSGVDRVRAIVEKALSDDPETDTERGVREVAREWSALASARNIDRYASFLKIADQPGLSSKQIFALAASDAVVGSRLAQMETPAVAELVRQRELVRAALDAKTEADYEIAIDRVRDANISASLAQQIIANLPAPPPPVNVKAIDATSEWGTPCATYLPSTYDRLREHPAIVTLHGNGKTPREQVEFWKGLAETHQMIVLAPEYLEEPNRAYEYSLSEHERLATFLAGARRSLSIDSDRVFLSGHELGAAAAYDLGMAHPDEWAGLVAVGGAPNYYAQYYWRNITYLPIYAVDGELNGDVPLLLRSHLGRFFSQGHPVLYAEYSQRAGGMFAAELPRIADWMTRQQRVTFPATVDAVSARHSDRRFYWMTIDEFMPNATIPPALFDKKKGIKPARVEAQREGNAINIKSTSLNSMEVLLSESLVQLDAQDLTIRVNGKNAHTGPVEPDVDTLVKSIRRTGDRKRGVLKSLRIRP